MSKVFTVPAASPPYAKLSARILVLLPLQAGPWSCKLTKAFKGKAVAGLACKGQREAVLFKQHTLDIQHSRYMGSLA